MSKYPLEIFQEYPIQAFNTCLISGSSLLKKEYSKRYGIEYFRQIEDIVLVKFKIRLDAYQEVGGK